MVQQKQDMTTTQDRGEFTSASSAQADSLCAGRFQAQKGCPDIKSSDAEYGTTVHAALAKGDPAGLNTEQVDIYDACLEIEGRMLVKYFGQEVEGLKPRPVCEKRFWIEWPDGLKHSGQVDRVHRKGTKALIVEWKTLSGDQPASPKNMQLRDQVCLFDANSQLLSEIAVCVVQPLATWQPELCVYTRPDIEKARDLMYARVKASNAPGAARTPGEAQCKWCRAKSKCPEYTKFATAIIPQEDESAKWIRSVPVSEWSPEQRVLFLNHVGRAQQWLDDCVEAMKKLLAEDPAAIPGFELKPGNKRETITNPQEVFNRFSAKGGSLEQFMGCISVAKSKLKEQLAAATKTKGKALDSQLKEITAGLVEINENKPSLKRKE